MREEGKLERGREGGGKSWKEKGRKGESIGETRQEGRESWGEFGERSEREGEERKVWEREIVD